VYGIHVKSILAAVDYSEVTRGILDQAGEMARTFGCPVTLLHVAPPDPSFVGYEPGPQSVRDNVAREFHEQHMELQAHADRLRAEGIDAKALLVQGPTVETILQQAKELGADLIVAGSHGHSALRDLLLGSVSEGLVRKAECPVLIVPSPRKG
jgi:nucleotide-binding universal stress UspA family protein